MPLQQFDERDPIFWAATQDSTFNPSVFMGLLQEDAATKRIDQILLTNGDTTDKTFTLYEKEGSTQIQLATITVVAGTGYAALPPLDIIAYLFGTTLPYWILPPTHGAYGKWSAAPAAGHLLGWMVKGGSF